MLRQLFTFSFAALAQATSGAKIYHSKDYPLGSEVENIVVRPSGSILTTVYTYPRLYEVSPHADATPKIIHTFPNTHGACGITESAIKPDEYFVVTGNFSFQTLSPTPKSYAIHKVSFDGECDTPIVKELAPLKEISQPNGMIHVPHSPAVLIADTRGGFIYRFNTETLKLDVYYDHPSLKAPNPEGGIIFGVNGVKFAKGYLYFSNTNQQFIARIKATGLESKLHGDPEIVAKDVPVDDFTVNPDNGDLYVADQGTTNGLGFLSHKKYGSVPDVLFGGQLLGPTAIALTKPYGQSVYVTVTGGFEQFATQNYTGGGRVEMIHFGAK